MDCRECQDLLLACAEGWLEAEEAQAVHAHLETCADCRAEAAATRELQCQLLDRGQSLPRLEVEGAVMARIEAVPTPSRPMPLLRRWGLRWGAAAGFLLLATTALLLFRGTPVHAGAAQVLTRGAEVVARLRSLHLVGRLRSSPWDNFASLAPEAEFSALEVWKEFGSEPRWRVEKPGRVVVMDGRSTLLYLRATGEAEQGPPGAQAYDTGWIHRIADLSYTLSHELEQARAKGWKVRLARETVQGRPVEVVTVHARAQVPEGDYLRNAFYDLADTRRVYRFDAGTGLLQGVQVHLQRPQGEVLLFEVSRIECNLPLDPTVFRLDLPPTVQWLQEPPVRPGDDRYPALGAEEAARTCLGAGGREDWAEAQRFWYGSLSVTTRGRLGGLEVRTLGRAFTSLAYPGQYVPYELRLRDGSLARHNLALRRHETTGRWYVDGGL